MVFGVVVEGLVGEDGLVSQKLEAHERG